MCIDNINILQIIAIYIYKYKYNYIYAQVLSVFNEAHFIVGECSQCTIVKCLPYFSVCVSVFEHSSGGRLHIHTDVRHTEPVL